jgi:hypothetical protein
MQLLAAVEADGSAPLVETVISTVGRLRRGMTAVIITPSLDPSWVRPLASLRSRGVACVVVTLDAAAYDRLEGGQAATTGETADHDTEAGRAPAAARPFATLAGTSCVVRHHPRPPTGEICPMTAHPARAAGGLADARSRAADPPDAGMVGRRRVSHRRDEYLDFPYWPRPAGAGEVHRPDRLECGWRS